MRVTAITARFAIIGLGLTAGFAQADVIRVPQDQPTIQAGIDAADPDDIVLVADGVYGGEGNFDISFGGKAITVRSENGYAQCVIDCENSGRGALFVNDETRASVLEGFTIKNGVTSPGTGGGGILINRASPTIRACLIEQNRAADAMPPGTSGTSGGGVYCNSGSPLFEDCRIERNHAGGGIRGGHGGGIYIRGNSAPVFNRCRITGNRAGAATAGQGGDGGGVAFEGGSTEPPPLFEDCEISLNEAGQAGEGSSGGDGGGVYCGGASPAFRQCRFIENTAGYGGDAGGGGNGGGLHLAPSDALIEDCRFERNRAGHGGEAFGSRDAGDGGWGGGLYASQNASPRIVRCTFADNSAGDGGGYDPESYAYGGGGGGIYSGSSLDIWQCRFERNHAGLGSKGTDPFLTGGDGGGAEFRGSESVRECWFGENTAAMGGGIYCTSPALSRVTDCTFERNEAVGHGGGAARSSAGSALIARCDFIGNIASSGGGIAGPAVDCTFIENRASASGGGANLGRGTLLLNCRFERNSARSGGGAESSGTVYACTFIQNEASDDGGGLTIGDGSLESQGVATSCLFVGNHADGNGGGINSRRATISNVTVYGNSARAQAGGMWSGAGLALSNSIVWANGAAPIAGVSRSVRYCDLEVPHAGPGNISAAPMFVDPVNGDFHLQPGSPAIDAGDPSAVFDLVVTDIDGQLRVWNGRVDMGADEFGSAAAGDVNCDGALDAFDIEPFILASIDPMGYSAQYPDCLIDLADINRDGAIDSFDIEPFIALLVGG